MRLLQRRSSQKSERLYSESRKGQISVMVGVMMMTFILFFAFVINVGMLVNAKINLQNAADLAAYAGASVQARQLTYISYLNYEMRRQWKKFLFRIYVLGNMSQDGFPRGAGGSGAMKYRPSNKGDAVYSVPTTCVAFNINNNYCHITTLPKIEIPEETGLDQISDTLRNQLQAIEHIRQDNCKSIGTTNIMLNSYWIFNTDPDLKILTSKQGSELDPAQVAALKTIQSLARGLGIVPKEIILRHRIKTLNDYVNELGKLNVTLETIQGLQERPDPSIHERTIQAFYSAYYTLGNHTYAGGSISMDELIPGDANQAMLLNLTDIKEKFDTYAIDLALDNNIDAATSANPTDCKVKINPIVVNQPITLGVAKNLRMLTYYAVRLKAKAQVLFSPFGTMELKAYSAARPFGSRIGPQIQENMFTSSPGDADSRTIQGASTTNKIPNLPIKASDSAARGSGWDTQDVLGTMYQFLVNSPGGNTGVTAEDMESAYQSAMAPNPYEAKRYNIINDTGTDSFVRNFDANQVAAFWAPVFSPEKDRQAITDELKAEIDLLFSSDIKGNAGASPKPKDNIKNTIINGLDQYITSMINGQGEEVGRSGVREGANIARISNPLMKKTARGDFEPITGNPDITLSDPTVFKSSWNTVNHGKFRKEKRVGYSVKFISFASLTSNKLTTDGAKMWDNTFYMDSDSELDIPFIKH